MALGFRGDDSLGGIWAFLTFQKQDRELSGLGLGAALGFGGVVCCRFGFGVLVWRDDQVCSSNYKQPDAYAV